MAVDFNGINQNRINDPQSRDIGKRADVKNSPQQQSPRTVTTGKTGESVSLSSQAKSLAQLENEVRELPDADQRRVAELKAQVESGSYQVDSKTMAQKMLNMEK